MIAKSLPIAALVLLACVGCQKKEATAETGPDTAQAPATMPGSPPASTMPGSAPGTASPEAMQQWSTLSASVPQMIEAIETRVNTLSESKKLPANLDRATFDSAKASLESMKSSWSQATTAHDSGDVPGAVAAASSIEEEGRRVLAQLGMSQAGG